MRRQRVSALRNSSSAIQPRCSTSTRRAHAESPPPKLASATVRKASASAAGVARGAGSLMSEVWIVRQLPGVVRVARERVGRLPVLRLVPVVVEQLLDALDNGRRLHDRTQLPPQVEGAAIQVHGAQQGSLAVGEEKLGVDLQVLLAAHLDVVAAEDAQRGEGVVRVPRAQPVLAAA